MLSSRRNMTNPSITAGESALDLVFWPGSLTLIGCSFEDQLAAAAAGRFTSIAISADTYIGATAGGRTARDIVALAAEHGLSIHQLDGASSWTPFRFPAELPLEVRDRFDHSPERVLDIAAGLGISTVVTVGVFAWGQLCTEELIPMFAKFCDQARERCLRVDLEFISLWGIPNLRMAWDIVRGADRENSGLLIDTWHLQKGSHDFEQDLVLLETIPGTRLANLQLADSLLAAKAATLFEDCQRFRRFPGEGEQSLERIVSIMSSKGGLQSVGPEVFSDEVATLSLVDLGRRAGDGTRRTLVRAGLAVS
jgi:sugar phosphate isomerase/epimerase